MIKTQKGNILSVLDIGSLVKGLDSGINGSFLFVPADPSQAVFKITVSSTEKKISQIALIDIIEEMRKRREIIKENNLPFQKGEIVVPIKEKVFPEEHAIAPRGEVIDKKLMLHCIIDKCFPRFDGKFYVKLKNITGVFAAKYFKRLELSLGGS